MAGMLCASIQVFALGINEHVDVRSLGYLPNENVVLLNRGLADDVVKNEHIQLFYNDKFIARAYSLQVDTHRSIWLIYQIANEGPLTEKAELKARRLPLRLVPFRVKNAAEDTRVDEIKQELLAQAPPETPEPAPRLKLGYKESSREDNEEIPITDPEGAMALNPSNNSVDSDAFQDEEAKKNFNVQLTAAPIKFSSQYHAREISYGTNVQSVDWGKKNLSGHYVYSNRRSRPSNYTAGATGIATSSSYDAGVNFDINNITEHFSFFSFATYQRERDGVIYPIRYRWNIAPVGLKYNIYNDDKIQDLSLSYAPIMEYELNDIPSTRTIQTGTDAFGNPVYAYEDYVEQKKFQRARHSFRFGFKWVPVPNFVIANTLWYRPSHDFSNKEVDLRDCRLSNDFSLGYNPSDNITLGYQNVYTWDLLQKRLLGLPSSNMDNIFTISYTFAL
ncbi:MAG: hypothetical protein HYV97_12420 [Bdellovibrio sp.]|nr:hypothetical protein [Bdellovibrio sp.]